MATSKSVLAAAPKIKQKKRRERLMDHAEDARTCRASSWRFNDDHGAAACRSTETGRPKSFDDAKLHVAFFEPLGFKLVLQRAGLGGGRPARLVGQDK